MLPLPYPDSDATTAGADGLLRLGARLHSVADALQGGRLRRIADAVYDRPMSAGLQAGDAGRRGRQPELRLLSAAAGDADALPARRACTYTGAAVKP